MRDYEAVYIFDSALEEARVNEKLERYHGLITGEGRGEITALDHWGKRQLAYAIGNSDNGYYVVAQYRTEAGLLPEYERLLKLDEELLRYLVVVNEGDLRTRPEVVPVKRADDEEEEEE